MTWLRGHVQHFCVPAIRALARGKPVFAGEVKPFDGVTRPASCCEHEEAALIYTTLTSVLPKTSPVREKALAMCRTLDGQLILGDRVRELSAQYNAPGPDVVHSIVRNSFRTLRRRAEREDVDTIVLPGRDVWAWEVLARRRRLPTVFDPVVSRSVAGNQPALSGQVKQWPVSDWSKALMFDTGFAGSIHRAVAKVVQPEPKLLMLSASDHMREKQLYPRHSGSRGKALAIEYIPKYWDSGFVDAGKPRQQLADLDEFVLATLTTIWLWYHRSKRWIERKKQRERKEQAPTYEAGGWYPVAGSHATSTFKVVPLPTPTTATGIQDYLQQWQSTQSAQELASLWGPTVVEDATDLTSGSAAVTNSGTFFSGVFNTSVTSPMKVTAQIGPIACWSNGQPIVG